ncbi:MAG: hypothetical protein ABII22_04215 [Candidatus Micrarchaeota archaeon]
MKSKGFIFSLDAFVAFTLSLVVISSLIFFSSIPSAHYATLMQAHYIAKDALLALSATPCADKIECGDSVSLLNYIVIRKETEGRLQQGMVDSFIGNYIPKQYGYSLSIYDKDSGNWREIFKDERGKIDRHVSVSEYSMVHDFRYFVSAPANIYQYKTCNGGKNIACSENQVISEYWDELSKNKYVVQLIRLDVFI